MTNYRTLISRRTNSEQFSRRTKSSTLVGQNQATRGYIWGKALKSCNNIDRISVEFSSREHIG